MVGHPPHLSLQDLKHPQDQSEIHPDEVFVKTDACGQLILNEYDPCKPNEYDKVHTTSLH